MSDIHRIGVISDTHIPKKAARVPDAALRHFENVELILHAGDLSSLAVLDQLSAYAPVEAVQGNVELPEVTAALPIKREIVGGGCVIGLVHILGERNHHARNARAEFPSARVMVGADWPAIRVAVRALNVSDTYIVKLIHERRLHAVKTRLGYLIDRASLATFAADRQARRAEKSA